MSIVVPRLCTIPSIHGPISPDIRKDEDVVHALLSVLRAEQSHGSI